MMRVGVAGWDYPDWAGVVYPSHPPRGFDRLAFLAQYFDLIEVNVTFYRHVEPDTVRAWARRVADRSDFRFTVKLFQGFTHPGGAGLERAALAQPHRFELHPIAATFRASIEPLMDAGLLGAVLAQFPHSFHNGPGTRDRLKLLRDLLPNLPLVAEFRHRSWDQEGALQLLRGLRIGFCNIDQPSVGATLGPTAHLTAPVAYIRLHGRNAENWFQRADGGGAARYDYLYGMDELRPWVERARSLGERAEETFIVANNHYRGKGPANSLMLKQALSGGRVKAPATLVAAYPELESLVDADRQDPAGQGRLF
jgi:uncharacterized protein YecE (DUF72 family)